MKQQPTSKAHKEGYTQTIKERKYFNPFSRASQTEKYQEFERGRKVAIEEMKITVEESQDFSSAPKIPTTKQ